jgi:D-alanyl-D-alanine carboxypeptidase
LALLGFLSLGFAQQTEATGFPKETVQALNAIIAKEMRENNLPSVVVAIWVPGEGKYLVARGKANLITGRKREPGDPFRIGSITKTFVGTAVLQLVDEGKLSTSDALSRWYPDFPHADKITIADLLRMRSGIADSFDEKTWTRYYAHPLEQVTAQHLIELAAQKADQFTPPDQATVYTNVNYAILGEIVHKVSGQPLGAFLSKHILKPLGLTRTLYPTGPELPGKLRGYSWNAELNAFQDVTLLDPGLPGAAGAMISDIWDLKTFAKALCTGTLLKPATQAARLKTFALEGSKIVSARHGEALVTIGKFCGHNGGLFGSNSEMWYLPGKDTTIVINVNRFDFNGGGFADQLFFKLTKVLFPEYVDW